MILVAMYDHSPSPSSHAPSRPVTMGEGMLLNDEKAKEERKRCLSPAVCLVFQDSQVLYSLGFANTWVQYVSERPQPMNL